MSYLSDKHRQLLECAPEHYRRIKNNDIPFCCDATFDGQIADLEYLDWLAYEGFDFDEQIPLGLEGAAVIWGNVFVRLGIAEWATVMEDRLVLQSTDHKLHAGFVWPLAHLWTCLASDLGMGSRFSWATQEVVIRFWQLLEDDNPARNALLELIKNDSDTNNTFWLFVREILCQVNGDRKRT